MAMVPNGLVKYTDVTAAAHSLGVRFAKSYPVRRTGLTEIFLAATTPMRPAQDDTEALPTKGALLELVAVTIQLALDLRGVCMMVGL